MNDNQLNEKIAEVSKTIFSYCMAKTPNREEAEDLCQDILCELVKSSKSIRNDEAFYGFMWAVAGNVYKHWCSKKTKNQVCELTDDIVDETPAPEEYDDENDDIYLIRRELSLLSQKYRRAAILYYIDQKTCSEIGQILSISESMVKYLLFKSRKILKEGMNMERKLGSLSYNPKSISTMYSGAGDNYFWNFMQSKIRQNIVSACYNDSLTPEQISLEMGIPLPYLDDEIKALEEKEILIKDGTHYKTNLIILTMDYANEMNRKASAYQNKLADIICEFLETKLDDFRQIGFIKSDFSDNSLRWLLLTFVLKKIFTVNMNVPGINDNSHRPKTGWGDEAYLWFVENDTHIFDCADLKSRNDDVIVTWKYIPSPKDGQSDFCRNSRYINILCDIAHGNYDSFSEYDFEIVAEMIRSGSVIKENDTYSLTSPIFTMEQCEIARNLVETSIGSKLTEIVEKIDKLAFEILSEHTPRHLQNQVAAISGMDRFFSAVSVPASIVIDRKVLSTVWNPNEMPTTKVILND